MIRHAPHALSAVRIPISLAVVVVHDQQSFYRSAWCLALVLIVFATDFLDGWIARKYSLQSKFGYLMDGLGDRAFHVTCVLVLLMDEVLTPALAWGLIFREISQFAVRIVEPDWHGTQSTKDRLSTRLYAIAIQVLMFIEICRVLIAPSAAPSLYVFGANAVLATVAIFSFMRIIPRLTRAWRVAVNG